MKSNIFKTFLQNIDSEYFEETQPLSSDWNCQMAKILRSTEVFQEKSETDVQI